MEITEKDIEHIASLAHLEFDADSKKALTGHLKKILSYVEKLNELDTTEIEPTSHVLPVQNVFKEDLTRKVFKEIDILQNAPRVDKGHYQVPKIIE